MRHRRKPNIEPNFQRGTEASATRKKRKKFHCNILLSSVVALCLYVAIGSFASTSLFNHPHILEPLQGTAFLPEIGAKLPHTIHKPPPATEPVTYFGHCENPDECGDVFYTETACGNSTFPYASSEEKKMFTSWIYPFKEVSPRRAILTCNVLQSNTPDRQLSRNGTVPWCQNKWNNSVDLRRIPTGCSLYSEGARSGAFQGMYLFPQGKLAYCGVPKSGITQWLQFLRFTYGAKDYQSFPHFKFDKEAFRFDRFKREVQQRILDDNSWTKAIFIRDPAERLLSAYLDKLEGYDPKRYFSWFQGKNISFPEFVDILSMPNATCSMFENDAIPGSGLSWCSDPHWRPQVFSCGIYELLPYFSFVGSLDQAGPNTKTLLESVGMWDSYGQHYRTDESTNGTICDKMPPPPLQPGEVASGFQQKSHNDPGPHGGGDTHDHNKNAKSKMAQYYTEDLLKKIRELYALDYALYDMLENRFGGRANGKDLARALNPSCS